MELLVFFIVFGFAAFITCLLWMVAIKDESPRHMDNLDKITTIKNIEWMKSYGEQHSKHKDS
jgi:hypothetical protein